MMRSEARGLALLEAARTLVVNGVGVVVDEADAPVVWAEVWAVADELRARAAALGVAAEPVQMELFAEVRP